ncbi:hypothetical protein BEH94_07425 [Candidatus Altiarchaeales archaeon WOR_SM1_SCG]|nr:hypothetical protein BEH94_07425 [Candidatus Altiarchaeales archaeon WOR_SM1_SCG]
MRQNINFTLIGLLVVVLVAMIAMSIYYQFKYAELAEIHKESLNANNNLSKELAGSQERILEKERELNEKIRNLNLSSSEVARFQNINENLTDEIEQMDFDNIYETLNELKFQIDLIENETARDELNNKINILEYKVVELENRVFTIKAISGIES